MRAAMLQKGLMGSQIMMPFSTAKPEKKVGIVGGLGPEATVHFLGLILNKTKELYKATCDQDHIHTAVEMDAKTPDRTASLAGRVSSSAPHLRGMTAALAAVKSDFIVCACNTAHAYEKDMLAGCGDVPFVSMIEVTANRVYSNIKASGGSMNCGIMATSGTISTGLYQKALTERGIQPVTFSDEQQALMMDIVIRIKAGIKDDKMVADYNMLINELKHNKKCPQIILGCTELPIVIDLCLASNDTITKDDFVDTLENMAEICVKIAKGDLEIKDALQKP